MTTNLAATLLPNSTWHTGFLALMPDIANRASLAFRHLRAQARAEAIQDIVVHAMLAYLQLFRRGKTEQAFPSALGRFAIAQYRVGRRGGEKLNSRDVMSSYAMRRKGIRVESFDLPGSDSESWRELLIEDKGDRLLPISPWMSEFLSRLLDWPGMQAHRELVRLQENFSPQRLFNCISKRLAELARSYCRLSKMPLYTFPVPELAKATVTGRLKVAIVQTALPIHTNFTKDDVELNEPSFRRQHRRHLAAMLRLLLKTLEVRKGYGDSDEHIDIVLFPELSVHTDDVALLTRFADSAKCMLFCGLVFHPMARNQTKLINSGLWILPVRTSEGRTLHFIEQGKWNLTPEEEDLGITPYRPCQWLIEAQSNTTKPWRLSAAICYDATDLSLAADLRNASDAFIVSALNQDIGTFDAMVSALHYHMFQHVVLVNSAEFGGSTAQAPYSEHYNKVIVHHHGKDQPVVSVIELDFAVFRGRPQKKKNANAKKKTGAPGSAKFPPAGVNR